MVSGHHGSPKIDMSCPHSECWHTTFGLITWWRDVWSTLLKYCRIRVQSSFVSKKWRTHRRKCCCQMSTLDRTIMCQVISSSVSMAVLFFHELTVISLNVNSRSLRWGAAWFLRNHYFRKWLSWLHILRAWEMHRLENSRWKKLLCYWKSIQTL